MNHESLISSMHPDFDYQLITVINDAFLNHYKYSLAGSSDGDIKAVLVDCESTGKDPLRDKLIEVFAIMFTFDPKAGKVTSIQDRYHGYHDPGISIPADITKLTGITDEMVKNQYIDEGMLSDLMSKADVVFAHNANFDRKLIESNLDEVAKVSLSKPWGCSYMDIPWNDLGFGSAKMDYLATKFGYTYKAHRAEIDVMANLIILDSHLPIEDGQPIDQRKPLSHLYQNTMKASYRLWALGSPFHTKDILKANGYSWSDGTEPGMNKSWYINVGEDELDAQIAFLEKNVYGRKFTPNFDKFDAITRYSVGKKPESPKMGI